MGVNLKDKLSCHLRDFVSLSYVTPFMTTMTTNSLVTSAEPFTMPHRICMVSLWCIPEYNPKDCKMNLSAQLCLKNFNKKCMIQAAMNRNIKLCRPLLFLDVLLDHMISATKFSVTSLTMTLCYHLFHSPTDFNPICVPKSCKRNKLETP